MEEVNDVQALEKISSEVDESQIKVILSSQCIKAQAYLLDKLKKQAERHKETCGFISSANLKLEAEIKQAEQEINSMLIAQESIKLANVEMKKEWLVAKERKIEITERIEEGIKKYESLWQSCKARYESIPFVQKLLQASAKVQVQNNDIDGLDKQIILIYESMKMRRDTCIDLDRKRCIELANFMVNEMPKTMKIITEKTENINDMTRQNREMIEEQSTVSDAAVTITPVEPQNLETSENKNKETIKDNDDDLNKSDEDALIPKLELTNFDLDIMDVNLERAKMKNDEIPNSFLLTTDPIDNVVNKIDQCNDDGKAYEYVISPYFNSYKEKESHNFSKRKLINILEDVHINNDEVYNIMQKLNPGNLRKINEISVDVTENVGDKQKSLKDTPIQSDTIEEVNMSGSNVDIIIPPTQFLDIALPGSQDSLHKKRVSFDIPSSIQINELIDEVEKQNDIDEIETANQTINSQLDASVVSEDSYAKIQDMIFKKHNLDLSPQFVYAKNPVLHSKRDDDKIVTSKFFITENQEVKTDEVSDNRMTIDEEPKDPEPEEIAKEQENLEELSLKDNLPMDVDEMIESSPKEKKKQEEPRSEKPVPGLLFTHGTQAIPDSLNASMSTTGYDDSDFPHCIDSSLLLSPKADIPMTGDNPDVQSQEVPNFLSGFRKTGLSFFGGNTALSSEPKPDSSAPNDGNNFSFNFSGEKKNRGGLFSLFN